MAGLKEIRRRLQSVKNTRKITYAMKLVSAAKLNKSEAAVKSARKYTNAINALLADLSSEQRDTQLSHPLLEAHENVKNIRVLVIGGSKGLCGGYNVNINRRVEAFLAEKAGSEVNIEWQLIGRKPAEYFRRIGRPALSTLEQLPDNVERWPLNEICTELETDYQSGRIDEVYLLFTRFKSAMSVKAEVEKLLPLEASSTGAAESADGAVQESRLKTIFEPSAQAVFSAIVPVILRCKLRQAALDAKTSEFGSRMTAMDSATRNADDLITRLQLFHNKLRQGGITSELLDIIGGAEALK